MRELVILFVHAIATLARLLGPGGIRSNLRILEVTEIKTVPYIPLSHPSEEPQRFTQRLNRLSGILEARNWRLGRAKANEYFRWAIRAHLAVSAR